MNLVGIKAPRQIYSWLKTCKNLRGLMNVSMVIWGLNLELPQVICTLVGSMQHDQSKACTNGYIQSLVNTQLSHTGNQSSKPPRLQVLGSPQALSFHSRYSFIEPVFTQGCVKSWWQQWREEHKRTWALARFIKWYLVLPDGPQHLATDQ